MNVLDRVETMRGARRKKRADVTVGDVEHENDRLHLENVFLRDQLHHERGELSRVFDVVQRGIEQPRSRKHRLRRIAVLGMAAGSAYVAGSNAGRERFDQIRERWSRMGHESRNPAREPR
jgi:hypothetical protein